tara:strand:- start:4469 stop:5287 length:819 start_codon:yes stop_codon:yes gene_type:complete
MANPIISNFFPPDGVTYYKPDGTEVRPDEELHIHADGTVMTEHSEVGGTNMPDTSVVVTTIPPNQQITNTLVANMDELEQEAFVNTQQSARAQRDMRRTLNRLGSTRITGRHKQRLQSKLAKLQNQAQQTRARRTQLNQARRGQISPNVMRRRINQSNQVSTPINDNTLIDNRPFLPNGQRPTTYGQPASQVETALNRREDRIVNRLSTGNNLQGRNLPAGSARDTSLRRPSSRGEQQATPRPTPRPPRRTGGSGGSSGGGGGYSSGGGGGY